MRHDPRARLREQPLFTRRRFQFAGALLNGALLPFAVRGTVLPGLFGEPASVNALMGNSLAIIIAFWMRLSIETYPGIRSAYVILPTSLTGHGIIVVAFLLTRLPYDRLALGGGFILHVLWLYALYFFTQRTIQQRIAIVPFGEVSRLAEIDSMDWQPLARPLLEDTVGCHAIVADFAADLPDEWEAFLADAALAGRIVYQVKQLSESLTGRVELDHLSENSFGSLLPARGYFHLKAFGDFLVAVLLLPVALPLMAVVALAIRLEGRGTILFRQARIGHAGRRMTVYKFRTMRPVSIE